MKVIILSIILFYFYSCGKDDNSPNNSDEIYADIGGNRLNFGPTGIQVFNDTCNYDPLLESYIIQLQYFNIKDVVIGSQIFSNDFIISVSLGTTSPVVKDFLIALPFSNAQFQFIAKDEAVVTFGGYIAKSGLVNMQKTSKGKYAVKFTNIEFYSTPKDTSTAKFIASAQIPCN